MSGSAQEIRKTVPDSLLRNAHVVILDEIQKIIIHNKSDYDEVLEKSYIFLNGDNESNELVSINEDQFTELVKATVKVFNKDNELIKEYSKKDFLSVSMGWGSVSEDNNIRYLRIPDFTPPYKVEVYTKIRHKGSLHYPIWMPMSREYIGVVSAKLVVEDYTKNTLRYDNNNIEEPIIEELDNKNIYTWNVNNKKAYRFESFNNIQSHYAPIVRLSPNEFSIDGYEGEMSSWKSFGNWVRLLNDGKADLSEDQKKEIRALVNGVEGDLEKTRIIYKFLQDNVRYASIQLGIGGWQPFNASYVHEKKYGDCKALTYYTKSMLQEVGVKSYYSLVNAGHDHMQVIEDFPNAYFNHAFLMVPIASDTVWLECTSQDIPFGFLGDYTNDRLALVISDSTSQLCRTKRYVSEENKSVVNARIKIDSNYNVKLKLTNNKIGLSIMDNNLYYIEDKREVDQIDWFYDHIDIGSYVIDDFNISSLKDGRLPEMAYELNAKLIGFLNFVGKRIIVAPFIFNHKKELLLSREERKHDIVIKQAYQEQDSIVIDIPYLYHLEKNIRVINKTSKFGSYSCHCNVIKDKLTCVRTFEMNKGIYKAEEYPHFKSFLDGIRKSDMSKLVFLK